MYFRPQKENMYRKILEEIEIWKNQKHRKPLIIQGARQVGKTWVMKQFGITHFKNTAYINFESSANLQKMFVDDFSISRIISTFEIESKEKIDANNTLIILDEIQEADKGLTALKYFYENAPEYFIIAAGSLLGVSLQKNKSFPVGKVDFLNLYPMSFEEFLVNLGLDQLLFALRNNEWKTIKPFHEELTHYLRLYYFVGGMPEAVKSYIETDSLTRVRTIQENILSGYENDFAKYAPNQIVPKIILVWQGIMGQLAKENRKFIYGHLKRGSRAKDFEDAISWLVNAGMLLKVNLINKPSIPIKSYTNPDVFKLFFLDVGLLNAMGEVDEKILLQKNRILKEFKGALTEQFVAQQLILNYRLFYWTADKATAEVDFVIQKDQSVIPIEVKAEENLKAKSLKVFEENYQTGKALRLSMSFYRKEDWLENIPLYAVFTV
jgi:uncharacterized protein